MNCLYLYLIDVNRNLNILLLLLPQVQAEQNQIRGQLEKAEHELISVKKDKDELHKKLQSSENAMNSYNSTVANFEAKIEKLQKEKVSTCTENYVNVVCEIILPPCL